MRRSLLWLGLSLLLSTPVVAAEKIADFAYKAPIQTSGDAVFYRVPLSTDVYRNLVRMDLGDLRVFNSAGEVVPHAIEPVRATTLSASPAIDVPYFPLPGELANATSLNVQVQTNSSGTVVSIVPPSKAPRVAPKVMTYLLDATSIKQPIQALTISLSDDNDQVSEQATVELSEDLVEWRTVARRIPIFNLRSNGQQLGRMRIEWAATPAKYLRLSFNVYSPNLARLSVEPAPINQESSRVWLSAKLLSQQADSQEFVFELPGSAAIDRVRMKLPQANTVAPVQIFTRSRDEDAWRLLTNATVYRLTQNNKESDSPPISLQAQRQLMLRFDRRGGGIGTGVPQLEAGWIPQSLVFAARGKGPFALGFGTANVNTAAYTMDKLIPGYGTDNAALSRVATATLGPASVSGGEAQLSPRIDFKRWVLWTSLVIGVLLLLTMATKLLKQNAINADNDSTNDQ